MAKKLNPQWEHSRKSHKKARAKLKKAGMCVWRCGSKAVKGKVLCKGCAEAGRERGKAYREKRRKELKFKGRKK